MKLTHIIILVVLSIGIAIVVSLTADVSRYVSFAQADSLAASGDMGAVHVVGKLKKNPGGGVSGIYYDPQVDPNRFEFQLVDTNKTERKVVYLKAKPQDFEKTEQVVIVGSMNKGVFVATDIQMKCPSKYENQKPQ